MSIFYALILFSSQNWWLLVFCVAGYLSFSYLLGKWDTERGHTIISTSPKDGNKIKVQTNIHITEKGDCEYELEAENVGASKAKASFKVSITEFIDAEGKFHRSLFALKFNQIVDQVVSQKKSQ